MMTINGGRRCYIFGRAIESLVRFTVFEGWLSFVKGTSNGSGGADPKRQ